MLRSKATAALMKLKEIDRKYKMKSREDVKLESSLSDISTIDGGDKTSEYLQSADIGDKKNEAVNSRPKLDIRMPNAHIMGGTTKQENEPKLVTIFNNKSNIHSPKLDSKISQIIINKDRIIEETNLDLQVGGKNISQNETLRITSLKNPSIEINEDQTDNTETSISEDLPEVISYSHPVSNHSEVDESKEITLKSVDSIIQIEERPQVEVDEDLSTLVASGMYSDDFVNTSSSANGKEPSSTSELKNPIVDRGEGLEPELISSEEKHIAGTPRGNNQGQLSLEVDRNTELEIEDIEEVVSAEISNTNSTNKEKKIYHCVSQELENPSLLKQHRSSKSSSARISSEERPRRRTSHTSSSSRDVKSSEISSSSKQKQNLQTTNTSGTLNPSKSNLDTDLNSLEIIHNGKEKELKNSQTVFFQEKQKNPPKISQSPQAVIRWEKTALKTKKLKTTKRRTRAKDSSTKEPPPFYSKESKTNKCQSVLHPVPVTMVGPISKYLQISEGHIVGCKPTQADPIPRQKRGSNKLKIEDTQGSKYRATKRSHRRCKNQTKEEPGLGNETRAVQRLRHQINELRLKQERDRLRNRVYVLQTMNEQRNFLVHDAEGFRGPIDQFTDYNVTRLGRSERLQSFFKPLDLPNVAAFERPDFEEELAADFENDGYMHLHMIRERILGIRHWIKQQFVLYRDYSNLSSTINAKYIPVTLEETKKMIQEDMQRFYNNCGERRGLRYAR